MNNTQLLIDAAAVEVFGECFTPTQARLTREIIEAYLRAAAQSQENGREPDKEA